MTGVHIVIYGSEACPFCTRAKNLAEEHNLQYEYINIKDNPDAFAAFEQRFTSMKVSVPRTVPQIFIEYSPFEDEYIGGFEDFEKWMMQKLAKKHDHTDDAIDSVLFFSDDFLSGISKIFD